MTDAMTLRLTLQNLSCGACAGRAEAAVRDLPGVEAAGVNLAAGTLLARIDGPDRTRAALAALEHAGYPARQVTRRLRIGRMSCASCAGRVEGALMAVPGVTGVSVNLASDMAIVTYAEGAVTPEALLKAAHAAGYPAQFGDDAPKSSAPREGRDASGIAARKAGVAAALTLPVFMLEMGAHMVPGLHEVIGRTIGHGASWWAQGVLTTAVLAGPGRGFYRSGLPALMRGAPDMNSLVALGTMAAYVYSLVALLGPGLLPDAARAVYFEAAAVIVTLILIGRWLEVRAKGRTGDAIRRLVGLQPRTARIIENGATRDVPIEEISVGATILVRPGERIAVDGRITQGHAHIDESMMTGEARPVARGQGDEVIGGTVNGTGSFRFRATRVGADTALAQIVRMVEEAQGAKLPVQGMVDRITLWFVPAILVLAAATVLTWLVLGPAPALPYALVAGVSVLIIACPCAMGLATPTSIVVGTGRAAQMGVLFRKGEALQSLSKVGAIALDKTGTLTEGRPELTDLLLVGGATRPALLGLAAAVEAQSEHPVAAAILRAAAAEDAPRHEASEFAAIPGEGVRACVDGQIVALGSARMMAREGAVPPEALAEHAARLSGQGRTALYAALDGDVVALIAVSDPVKPSSAEALRMLQGMGLDVVMITGDAPATAEAIARDLGITQVVSGVAPDGKVAALERLRNDGRKIAFVGDGINDAPALAHADVGIAIGTGTDIAIESAEIVLISGDLRGVAHAIAVSKATMRNIRQNLFWAFGYNVALIPVAAGALYPAFGWLLSPMLAAGAMALSSVFVLSNALRLRRMKMPSPAPMVPGVPPVPQLGRGGRTLRSEEMTG